MATIEISVAEDGTSIDAHVGDTILVRLPDNPTTGYRWELEPVAGDHVTLEDSGYQSSSPAIGGGGAAAWTLRAVSPGATTIRLKRWRPWEGDASVLERFAAAVHVHR